MLPGVYAKNNNTTVFGKIILILYINGIKSLPLSANSHLTLFADDMLLYRPISCEDDFSLLQEYIDRISNCNWVDCNYLQFNVQKYKLMHVSRKTQSPFTPCLQLHNQQLEMVSTYKYLGLLLSNDLSWSQYRKYLVCSKARKILGLIYRRFYQFSSSESLLQMYISLVRPNVEYASQVWSPYKIGEVNSIESVKKFALRMHVCKKLECWI